jgi:hypothetical protein
VALFANESEDLSSHGESHSAVPTRRLFDSEGARSVVTYVRLFSAGVGDAGRTHAAINAMLKRVEAVLGVDI